MRRTKGKKQLRGLGLLEELEDPDHLKEKREKAEEDRVLDQHCQMLETQINSLVDKLLHQTRPKNLVLYHPESDCYFLGGKKDIDGTVEQIMTTQELLNKLPELL